MRGSVGEALEANATPFEIVAALIETLASRSPTVLVLEDVHLADEATLDVLRILGAHAESVPAMVVLTYRDDALDRWHPVRIVLGEIARAAQVKHLKLAPLSAQRVEAMAGERVTAKDLYSKTRGNPFFVTGVLGAPGKDIPETVRDAVLGRCARLSAGARRLLDAVAITRPHHELARLVVEEAMPPPQRHADRSPHPVSAGRPGAVGRRSEAPRSGVRRQEESSWLCAQSTLSAPATARRCGLGARRTPRTAMGLPTA